MDSVPDGKRRTKTTVFAGCQKRGPKAAWGGAMACPRDRKRKVNIPVFALRWRWASAAVCRYGLTFCLMEDAGDLLL